jgi:aminopeptidase N
LTNATAENLRDEHPAAVFERLMNMKIFFSFAVFLLMVMANTVFGQQIPPNEAGVSRELARYRAAHYSDVRYKLNLTLEKMSPVLKGSIEIRVKILEGETERIGEDISSVDYSFPPPSYYLPSLILDWRKIRGKENLSIVSNVEVNGAAARFEEINEHLIFREGVKAGENVIKLDFTSPIATGGAAITRYVDKEDNSEYIYSLFVPSDASTAFPCFDQPDLKARFALEVLAPKEWQVISNGNGLRSDDIYIDARPIPKGFGLHNFIETKPISTYVFAFAAGEFVQFEDEADKGKHEAFLEKLAKSKKPTIPNTD